MKKQLFYFFMGVLLCTSFIFAACNDDTITSDGKVSGKLKIMIDKYDDYEYVWGKNVSNEVDYIEANSFNVNSDYQDVFLADCKVSKGSFSLTLPVPPAKTLYNISNEVEEGITISDKTAKVTEAYLYAFKDGEEVEWIERYSADFSKEAVLVYADKSFSIVGSISERDSYDNMNYTYSYNAHLKKGWNTLVATYTKKGNTVTTKITANNEPSGMIWGVELDDDYYKAPSIHSKKKKSFLKQKD